jgi:predicted DCC family thiol-disulfide oxidoreductase YuxK
MLDHEMHIKTSAVLYFDGVCGLCNAWVDFVIHHDKKNFFKFSPLQSDYAKRNLPQNLTTNLNTLVVQTNETVYLKSDAVIYILATIGGVFYSAQILKLIPRFIRDVVYDLIAKVRYIIFGKREACRIPSAQEMSLFLLE